MTTDGRPPYGDPAAPHRAGQFGDYGGRFVPEALVAALDELDEERLKAAVDPAFQGELDRLHRTYTGRPSLLTEVPTLRRSTPAARGSCSSARTSTTPARTRSTTCSARPC